MIHTLMINLEAYLMSWLGDSTIAAVTARLVALAVALLIFWLLYRLINKLFLRISTVLEDTKGNRIISLKIQRQEILSAENVTLILIAVSRFASLALRILLVLTLVNTIFSMFSWTETLARGISGTVIREIMGMGKAIINYLPDLAVVIMIGFLSIMLMRLLKLVFNGIATQRIVLPGFYPEWAGTTLNLLKILVIALTVVIIFPYLPGSDSPAFQGVSIFFGVLFSLGSTSAVANVVAGIVITYTRAFKVGDRIKINDTEGRVIERSSFVTRILTPKKVEVSIPNATVMNSHIINYSTQADQTGVLLHTSITIGYDVAWQKVHELLLSAAVETEHVESEPAPFVLQTALDDNYVAYEINVTTRRPNQMATIYSDLHANILDSFHGEGVEILSPHYRANRDGTEAAIAAVAAPGNEA